MDLSSASTQNVEELALQMAQDYERSTVKDNNNIAKNDLPHELKTKITSYGIKKEFVVQDQLPQFFFVKSPVEFPDAKVGLTTNKLEKDFNLQKESESSRLQRLEKTLEKRVIGQHEAVVFGMVGDVVEFGQWKTHIRQESLIFAGGSIGTKVGAGLASALMTDLLSFAGYVSTSAGAAAQPESIELIRPIIESLLLLSKLLFLDILILIFIIPRRNVFCIPV